MRRVLGKKEWFYIKISENFDLKIMPIAVKSEIIKYTLVGFGMEGLYTAAIEFKSLID